MVFVLHRSIVADKKSQVHICVCIFEHENFALSEKPATNSLNWNVTYCEL